MNAIVVLSWRELRRFFRQPTRLLGSLAQPFLFWLFMGAGFAESFRSATGDTSYSEFFFPGVVLMLLLFAGVFSTITLIEDRTAGFLQGVLVAPVSRLSLVVGKVLGGTLIALLQVVIFLAFAPLAGISLSVGIAIDLVLLSFLVGLGFTGLGFIFAWVMDTVAGYHAVMSVVMIPMWLLSGALFPVENAAAWLNWVMRLNPVTYSMTIIRVAFYKPFPMLVGDGDFLFALAVTILWTAFTLAGSLLVVVKKTAA